MSRAQTRALRRLMKESLRGALRICSLGSSVSLRPAPGNRRTPTSRPTLAGAISLRKRNQRAQHDHAGWAAARRDNLRGRVRARAVHHGRRLRRSLRWRWPQVISLLTGALGMRTRAYYLRTRGASPKKWTPGRLSNRAPASSRQWRATLAALAIMRVASLRRECWQVEVRE